MFGLIKKYSVHMCSEVKGVITLNGNPVAGVLINRSLKFVHNVIKNKQDTHPKFCSLSSGYCLIIVNK
ncbi:hypothetical protein PAT01_39380 [Pseudoalteromonas atlantica]|uniref:Uncharacterized protein n=1 Tax=Pseudoalteromonas atlantica TaxID=288 RepID=A0ABQ0UNF3_PSEAF|nr:hypothetical protein PAT01_39380 [Pseudoalteromonas atlantica]